MTVHHNPTEPGIYLLKRPDEPVISVEIRRSPESGALWMLPPEGHSEVPFRIEDLPNGCLWAHIPIPAAMGGE